MTERIAGPGDPVRGRVRWSPAKSLWWTGMTLGWLVGGTAWFSPGAVAAFFVTTAFVLCFGHSLGMHRWLIHASYDCPLWLGRTFVWLGTLTGLDGPRALTFTHDVRDWAQRQPACHSFLRHGEGFARDFWWQLHCKLDLDEEPAFEPGERLDDPFFGWLDRTAMAQQLPVALVLYLIGGPGFVAWGVCGRVSVSVFGHWLVGWFAHGEEPTAFPQAGNAVHGRAVPWAGLVSFGEAWHDNHHAFPHSAKLGLLPGQPDPGWWALRALARAGLVWNVRVAAPALLPEAVNGNGTGRMLPAAR